MPEPPRCFPAPWHADPMPGGARLHLCARHRRRSAAGEGAHQRRGATDRNQRRAAAGAAWEGESRLTHVAMPTLGPVSDLGGASRPPAQKVAFSTTILMPTVIAADSSAEIATRIIVSRQVIQDSHNARRRPRSTNAQDRRPPHERRRAGPHAGCREPKIPLREGWLGHRSITSTAVYTALAPNRFKDFWRD
jgi:hypothetical protein